jgi:hypothetical protein
MYKREVLGWLGAFIVLVGCEYTPNEGRYQLVAEEVFRDTCGLVTGPNQLFEADFHRSSSLVIMPLEFHNIELRGFYLTATERFSLDGTALQVGTVVNGQPCIVDWVGVHLEGEADSATQFSGPVRVRYEAELTEACRCELEARYTATLWPP